MSELRVESLSVNSGTERRAPRLENLRLQLPSGGLTLLIGRTGSGKSTLLHVLAGLEAPAQGNVYYDHQPLWHKQRPNAALLRQNGVVFQYPEHQLFARTGQMEFDYSLRPYHLGIGDRQPRIAEALDAVALPMDVLGEFPLTLSGGQQRRLAIATTLATRPDWLLLDEPTAGLDAQSSQALLAFLLDYLTPTSRSAVVATHDLETFLPVATSIVFLRQGQVLAHYSVAEALRNPEIFAQAEVGYPTSLQLRLALQARGFSLPSDTGISAQEMASAIAIALRSKHDHSPQTSTSTSTACATQLGEGAPHTAREGHSDAAIDAARAATAATSPDRSGFDVRAKWLFYVLLSTGVFLQTHWYGLLTATAATFVLMVVSKLDLRNLLRTVRPILYLMGVSVALAGVHWQAQPPQPTQPAHAAHPAVHPAGALLAGLGFSFSQATPTLWQTWKFWLLLVLGIWFSVSSSQLEMRKGLEQIFGGLAKLRFPVAAFALAVTLVLRFLPLLSTEQARFATITRSRGKSKTQPGRLRLRDLSAFTIPMLLSLFRLGENLALAMEARGCSRLPVSQGTQATPPPQFRRKDWLLTSGGITLLLLLVAVAHA